MPLRFLAHTLLGLLLLSAVATAQQYPPNDRYQPQPGGNVQPAQPDQPVQPQDPRLEPRTPQPGMPQPGIQQPPQQQPAPQLPALTPQEEADRDQVLKLWEDRNSRVKTFDCRFKRWVYDTVFGPADTPRFVELGVLRYSAPDKGMFRVDTSDEKGKEVPVDPRRAEHWISDGKSIIEFDHVKKQVIVHKLPPEAQGKAIADTPLPFLFGSDAKKLKERYFIKVVTPREVQGQIWLEAFPRFQQDAANFHHAQFIISAQGMAPFALKLFQSNQKDCVVYQFFEIVMNEPFRLFTSDPFRPITPFGWRKIIEEPQGAQAQRPPNDGRR